MKFFNLVILSFVPFFAYGSFPLIKVKNMNGDYLDGKGKAHSEMAKYSISKVNISHQDISIDFNKKEKHLILKDDTTSVDLDFNFSFLNIFKAFTFKNVDVSSDSKLFSLSSEYLDLYILPKKYHFQDVLFKTDINGLSRTDGEDITIVDGLVLNANLKMKKIGFGKFDPEMFDDLRLDNPNKIVEVNKLERRGQALEIPMIIRNIVFQIKKGKFFGKAKIDSYINLWFRVSGTVKTDKDNSFLTVTINRAKLGIFSIRSTIMNMIKRLNLDSVVVKGRTIVIDLRNVVVIDQSKTNLSNHK